MTDKTRNYYTKSEQGKSKMASFRIKPELLVKLERMGRLNKRSKTQILEMLIERSGDTL